MNSSSELPETIGFGRFRVLPRRRELLSGDRRIELGGRAFDVLMVLIEARGEIMSKDALLERVWPGQVVEENNLEVQISFLRTAFGDERKLIRTVARRGYQFTGELRFPPDDRTSEAVAGLPESAGPSLRTNLPQPTSDLIGRHGALAEILSLAAAHRLVTLSGPGGIGKTRLALACASRQLAAFADGVWLSEFSALTDPALVPATIATAVGIELGGGDISTGRVARALGHRPLLLVLDTCEHVIDAAAEMAEAVLRAGPATRIIATSREPLKVEGEWVYPVPPLAIPAADTLDGYLSYGAVELFVERARAADPGFAAHRPFGAGIAAICRQLDGIPLAIELAAARAAAVGVEELAARLDDRFRLLTGGRRTALPRHQTLRATLDWSHSLLSPREGIIFRRLGVFAGHFSLDAACTVAACPKITPAQVMDHLSAVVAKSLVVAESDGSAVRYRLLDTTRSYARERLEESGERDTLARRHAEYYRDLLQRDEAEWNSRPAELLADRRRHIDNMRSAMDWAFSPDGDAMLGVALTSAAIPLWMHLSSLAELRGRVEQAIAALADAGNADARLEMKLQAALGRSLSATGGSIAEVEKPLTRALHLAESLGDVDHQLRTLTDLWITRADREAITLARRFAAVASTPADQLFGEFMIGASSHWLGDLNPARRHLERVVADGAVSGRHIVRYLANQWALAQALLARILWLQGFPQQAIDAAKRAIENAQVAGHAFTLCRTVARAGCPIALWVGDLDLAERYIDLVLDELTRHGLALWRAFANAFRGVLCIRRGDLRGGLPLVRSSFDAFGEAIAGYRVLMFLGDLAAALGGAGQVAEGLATVNDAIERSERDGELWIMAEFLRIKGELLALQDAPGAAEKAEACFRESLAWGERQNALAWQLRAATSLARLLRTSARVAEAIACLTPIYDRFTEGFDTGDLAAARALLGTMRQAAPSISRT